MACELQARTHGIAEPMKRENIAWLRPWRSDTPYPLAAPVADGETSRA
jgi:hypothetical protein